jgi:cell division inhibitor SepF
MHRMGVYLGLVEDDEYGDADGYGPATERVPARRDDYGDDYRDDHRDSRESRYGHHGGDYERGYERGLDRGGYDDAGTSVGYADEFPHPATTTYSITALHPRTYNEARTIGEAFRKNTPVIMNLSEMDDADAKRLVDFAAGLTFGLRGRIERVTAKVFLLSPHNVTVTAQDKARIENGFFNQS